LAQVAQVVYLQIRVSEGLQEMIPSFPQSHQQVVVVEVHMTQAVQEGVRALQVVLGVVVEETVVLRVLVVLETRQT
jgi:hypothetical protein